MSGKESLPFRFQEVITYKDHSQSPAAVAKGTANLMNIYFKNALPDPKPVREYIASDTLDYVYNAHKGFLQNFEKISPAYRIEKKDLEVLLGMAPQQEETDDEETEAFGHALVVFSMLPDRSTHQLIPRFSKRGMLAPPATTMEFLGRLHELHSELKKIVSGETTPQTKVETRNSLWRTFLYFQVAQNLPLRMEESPRLIEEKTRDTIESMLGDISIDL